MTVRQLFGQRKTSQPIASAGTSLALLVTILTVCSSANADWQRPKTSFGDPDIQGVWSSATITGLERAPGFGDTLVVSDAEAKKIEANYAFNVAAAEDNKPTDPSEGAPTDGDAGNGYNAFWLDPGKTLMRVNGEARTSFITNPGNGKTPYSTAGLMAFGRGARNMGTDNPEQRPLGERCLVGFGSSGGPPMLPVLYNNHYQIVQAPGYVMILVEMNHDARIIRLNSEHSDERIKPWLGDSIGHWEGNTLVVETINVHPQQTHRYAYKQTLYVPSNAKITERFTRIAEDEITYQFTVEHPEAYTQAWTGELAMRSTDAHIFEYACHEGNYAMPGILAGARFEEKNQQ